jgi:zinc protease
MIGSSYESTGRSGFAHLFEHMMFQGSKNLAKNEHGRLIDSAGGRWNASTNKDRTNYYETVPSHYLDLILWLEADRMEALEVTPENFENQRQTVIEEKKQMKTGHTRTRLLGRCRICRRQRWNKLSSSTASSMDPVTQLS